MNAINIDLFKRLCLNLGARNVPYPDVHQLGDLKNRLLELTKAMDRNHEEWSLTKYQNKAQEFLNEFNPLFGMRLTSACLENPIWFRDVYQILSFVLKVPMEPTEQQQIDYIQKLREIEAANRSYKLDTSNEVLRMTRKLVRLFCANLDMSPSRVQEEMRHGPGSVYGGERGAEKDFFNYPSEQLCRFFPWDLFFANSNMWAEMGSRNQESPVLFNRARLALVPKDYKGPRGVFVSSKEAICIQLGVGTVFKKHACETWLGCCWRPYSQIPSQEHALEGSASNDGFTIDLSDASDRITNKLVSYLFPRPVYLALAATRPCYLDLPNGEVWKLAMHAPMGDGKTFEVLSIVCSCLAIAASLVRDGWVSARHVPANVLYERARLFAVTGDDVAGPRRYGRSVMAAFALAGLKVNERKSFTDGPFRESCGMDAFKGICVTPVRLKFDMDSSDELAVFKAVDLHNRICVKHRHLSELAWELRRYITRLYPRIGFTSRCDRHPNLLQTWTPLADNLRRKLPRRKRDQWVRYNLELQQFEVKCLKPRSALSFLEPSDSRWKLSYQLIRGGKADEAIPSWVNLKRPIILGSPSLQKDVERWMKRLGCRVNVKSNCPWEVSWECVE